LLNVDGSLLSTNLVGKGVAFLRFSVAERTGRVADHHVRRPSAAFEREAFCREDPLANARLAIPLLQSPPSSLTSSHNASFHFRHCSLLLAGCNLDVPCPGTFRAIPATEAFASSLNVGHRDDAERRHWATYYKDITVGTGPTLTTRRPVLVDYAAFLRNGRAH
jgi:hypothetical protein